MSTLTLKKLSPTIGAEVSDLDLDRLLNDAEIPDLIWAALREHGVLLFHDIGFEIDSQVKFGWRLGEVDRPRRESDLYEIYAQTRVAPPRPRRDAARGPPRREDLRHDEWQRAYPAKPGAFDCSPSDIATIKMNVSQ
jgi:alpha-ketoglutarate-dependent taurine dioxygenase